MHICIYSIYKSLKYISSITFEGYFSVDRPRDVYNTCRDVYNTRRDVYNTRRDLYNTRRDVYNTPLMFFFDV